MIKDFNYIWLLTLIDGYSLMALKNQPLAIDWPRTFLARFNIFY
jgi:hypothetical protein